MFKQASCVPDNYGHCPTSLLVPSSVIPHPDDLEKLSGALGVGPGGVDLDKVDLERASGVVKVWFRCGGACWRKDVNFGPGEVNFNFFKIFRF